MNSHAASLDAVKEAAFRPLARSSRRFWLLVLGLAILTTWSTAAWVVQLIFGLGVAGYDDRGFWGIYEANLVTFIAVSYGGALVSAILRLTQARWRAPITRLAEAMALFSLLVGMVFAVVHLGRPERVWRMFVTPQLGSPIFWDLVVISTYLLTTAIFLYLPLIPDIALLRDRTDTPAGWRSRLYRFLSVGWNGNAVQHRLLERGTSAVAILIIPIAVLVHSVLSWAFAMTGRPGWNSTILAPYFVVAALYAGIAMVILVVAGFRAGYGLHRYITIKHFRYLSYLMLTLNLAYLYFTFTELITEGYIQNEETVTVLESLLLGRYAWLFATFNIFGGLLPFVLVALPRTRTITGIVVAASFVVVGMWLKRMLIVVPVVTQPLIGDVWGVLRITWVAAGVTIGAAAAIPLLLMLFFKVFPVLSVYEMEELGSGEEPSTEQTPAGDLSGRNHQDHEAARAPVPAVFAIVLGLATALLATGVAHADGGLPTTVVVGPAQPTSARERLALSARLTTADGKPASNQPVLFFLHVTLFGDREALLGTATTDSTGTASLSYQPTQAGTQTISARFDGTPQLAASSGSADIQVAQASPAIDNEPLPFAGLREWLPSMLVAVVIGVWVVLLGIFGGTVRGIRKAART